MTTEQFREIRRDAQLTCKDCPIMDVRFWFKGENKSITIPFACIDYTDTDLLVAEILGARIYIDLDSVKCIEVGESLQSNWNNSYDTQETN